MKKHIFSILIALFILPNLACGLLSAPQQAKEVVDTVAEPVDQGVALYVAAQKAAWDFGLCIDTEYAKIQLVNQQAETYYKAVNANTESWSGHFKDQEAKLNEAMANYVSEADPDKSAAGLDLAELQSQGALPDKLGPGFGLFVNSVVQAPPPVVDSEITKMLINTSNEAMNTVQNCGRVWNNAVADYNGWSERVSGDIITAVAQRLGKDLPDRLEGYKAGNSGPISNPIAPK